MTSEDKKDFNPLAPYADVAGQVVQQIGVRAGTDGDPQLYGAVYTSLAAAYLHPVVGLRGIGPADIYVLDVLRAVALAVSGGMQAQRFRDIATAALAGSVHVEAATAAVRAAQNGQNGAQAGMDDELKPVDASTVPAAPEPAFMDEDPTPPRPMEDPALFDQDPRRAAVEFEVHPAPDLALAAADEDDEARASDVDLLRWSLNPQSDPWSDLLDGAAGDTDRAPRDGVTPAMVQARFDRLHAILDTSRAPDGVTKDAWQAAQRRVLPTVYGDRGAA